MTPEQAKAAATQATDRINAMIATGERQSRGDYNRILHEEAEAAHRAHGGGIHFRAYTSFEGPPVSVFAKPLDEPIIRMEWNA